MKPKFDIYDGNIRFSILTKKWKYPRDWFHEAMMESIRREDERQKELERIFRKMMY